jgi:hypothetical protein
MIGTSFEIGEDMEIPNDLCQAIATEDLGTICVRLKFISWLLIQEQNENPLSVDSNSL